MSSNSNEMLAGDQVLSRAAGMVSAAKADFIRDAANLESQINGARSRWQGQGGTAFFALHQAWTEKQRTILGALERFEDSLVSTERINTAADDEAAANQAHLAGRLTNVDS